LLPREHYLRSFGQSNACCPQGFYYDQAVISSSFPLQIPNEQIFPQMVRIRANQNPIDIIKPCEGDQCWNDGLFKFYTNSKEHNNQSYEDDENAAEILYTTFHDYSQYELWRFMEYLYYPVNDYRVQPKLLRISHEQYVKDAAEVQKLTRKTDRHINGVCGMWMFRNLHYQNIEINIDYDPFHVLTNLAGYILKLFLGLREINTSTLEFCMKSNMHPKL
jgi:hypothetical protein